MFGPACPRCWERDCNCTPEQYQAYDEQTKITRALDDEKRKKKADKIEKKCPFCNISPKIVVCSSLHSIAIHDKFPVVEHHTLVIPKRHVVRLFGQLSDAELADIYRLAELVRMHLINQFYFNGFNIGINDGTSAGQTIDHAHIHIIPRKNGDVPDPRGGIRWIIPDKAKYWKE